jgi:hypothetical protein
VTPWDETTAFKRSIIDNHGQKIKTNLNTEDQAAYTLFDRLVFNIKRLIEKIPGGITKIGTYAAALFLIREEMGDEEGILVLERSFITYLKENNAVEATYLKEQYLPEDTLSQGNYKLNNNMLDTKGNSLQKGTLVVASHDLKPVSRVLGVDVYQVKVATTGRTIVVSRDDIVEI